MRRSLIVALLGVIACSRSSEPVYIGVAGPWKEAFGRMNKQGIDLALSEINARGGVRGRPLRIVERDDDGDRNQGGRDRGRVRRESRASSRSWGTSRQAR